jgi:hypothetical protein
MKFNPENLTKIVLAILLLLCLFRLPYGYYELVRFIAVIGFAILAWYEYEQKNIPMVIIYVALAFLFQPLYKISLGRQVWNIVDVVVTTGLILTIIIKKKRKENN